MIADSTILTTSHCVDDDVTASQITVFVRDVTKRVATGLTVHPLHDDFVVGGVVSGPKFHSFGALTTTKAVAADRHLSRRRGRAELISPARGRLPLPAIAGPRLEPSRRYRRAGRAWTSFAAT